MHTAKIKKRHRKDLSADEIEAIVRATQEPYRLQKDVAQEFQVTARLVHGLVRESQKKPEKLEQQRRQEDLGNRKRQAIEECIIKTLSYN